MTLRALVGSGLLAVGAVAPALADNAQGAIQISAQVVRSCRVATDQPQVSVTCGARPQPVQVTYEGAAGTSRQASGPSPSAPAGTVTIQF